MHIGLIGGIGPAATDYYYRSLIAKLARYSKPFDITIVHADASMLLERLSRNDVAAQVGTYTALTNRLVAVEADCVVVTSIAGHFCIDAFADVSPLPVINMISEIDAALQCSEVRRVGILGTQTVMETQLYGGVHRAELVAPLGNDAARVHEAYVEMATAGVVTDAQRRVFDNACSRLKDEAQVDAIMLGGTDLALVYNENNADFPIIDCARIHVDAIVQRTLEQSK